MVHQYKLNGYNIVIDTFSNSVHLVDDVAYDIIRLFCVANETESEGPSKDDVAAHILESAKSGAYGEEVLKEGRDDFIAEINECYDDVVSLINADKLFSKDTFKPNANTLKNRHTDIKALCLHVSHACDLTCSYCFAGQGKFNGPSALMSFDVAKRAIDFLVENSGTRRNLEVDFFGGEPLLNFDVVKRTVEYARSIEKEANKNFRFTLTTNGMGITDEVIDFANRECYNVVLSLDGRKEVHDRERCTAGSTVDGVKIPRGVGSYDIIVPKFQRLVAARTGVDIKGAGDIPEWITKGKETGNTNYYIRGTFTHYNPDFTEDIKHMLDLGFTELSLEPVVCDSESRFALTDEDLPIILDQYEKLAELMMARKAEGKPFTFYHYMLNLKSGPCIYKRISGCGSGTEYFAVTPKGELYPCHQFVGDENYLMGDIWNGIEGAAENGACDSVNCSTAAEQKSGADIRDEFKMCNVYARSECDDCWAKLYCSGGCAANAYHATGNILGVYKYGCELFKKRMECAIMMHVAEYESGQETEEEMSCEN